MLKSRVNAVADRLVKPKEGRALCWVTDWAGGLAGWLASQLFGFNLKKALRPYGMEIINSSKEMWWNSDVCDEPCRQIVQAPQTEFPIFESMILSDSVLEGPA